MRWAHGAQKPRHINRIVEVASTAQRSDSPAQAINQGFLKYYKYDVNEVNDMAMTSINVRVDEQVKKRFTWLCDDIGMNLSTAINIFMKAALR